MSTSLMNDPVPDLDEFRLRRFVDQMIEEGEVDVVEEPSISPILLRGWMETKTRSCSGRRDQKSRDYRRHDWRPPPHGRAFGVEPADLLAEVNQRLDVSQEVIELESSDAPVHDVIVTGDEVDLTALPVHLQHELDGAPYISASLTT